MALDAMHQLYRFARRRNDVKPAAGGEAVRGQSHHAVGDGIAAMIVLEEPGFVAAVAQRGLTFREVHANSIVNAKAKPKISHGFARINTDSLIPVLIRVHLCVSVVELFCFASTCSRFATGSVSHAVRSTSRGVRSRIVIR